MKKIALNTSLIMSLSWISFYANSSEIDPYLSGFKNYMQENPMLSGSIEAYVEDVTKTQKATGYIGPKVPLPQPVKVMDGVYTIVGSLIWHTPENYGLNNNLSWVEFNDGVFVFNAGPNPAVAASFHQIIKQHTKKPVKWLAVENFQGHAYLGASYWAAQGVKHFYSQKRAHQDFINNFDQIKQSWSSRVSEALTLQAQNVSDRFTVFDDKMTVNMGGGETIELLNFGPGHTPGSTVAYIPTRNLLFTGDVGYNTRSLAFFSYTHTGDWIHTFKAMKNTMPPDVKVIPGHGAPTDMETVTRDTLGYLEYLHNAVKTKIAEGGTEEDMASIDQSAYEHRPVFKQTAEQNAVHVYKELTGKR